MIDSLEKVKYNLVQKLDNVIYKNKQKIFCIGNNKTGTTSLTRAMKELGYKVGSQREAELLFNDWMKRDFSSLIKYCKKAEFFQDIPFSLPFTFMAMDSAFPNSKFILTERKSPEVWYNSVVSFASKLFSGGEHLPPTGMDLKSADYIYKGRPYDVHTNVYGLTEDNLYDKKTLINYYNNHLKVVKDYFKHRPHDLLIIKVAEKDSHKKLCDFLGVKSNKTQFDWVNRTIETQANFSK